MSIERTTVNPPRRILRIWLAASLISAAVFGLARAQSTIQGNQGDKPASGQATGTISGRILVSDGGNAARATVALRSVGDSRGSGGQTVLTDEEGNFQFKDLPPRSYRIFAYGIPGYVQAPTSLLENELTRYYHIGDNATINFIRGGAITGRVTDAGGLPVVDVQVSATMKRDAEGNPVPARSMGQPRYTDDRGVYRLYGLVPGTYIIAANKGPNQLSGSSPYEGQVPTYYPSSTIDTAGEITVGSGGEVGGADIRYLGGRGQTVSGKILNGDPASSPLGLGVWVSIFNTATGAAIDSPFMRPGEGAEGYAVYGVPDGEYEVVASRGAYEKIEGMISLPRKISVKGSDLTGIDIKMIPYSSISGKLVLSSAPEACPGKPKSALEEFVLSAKQDPADKNNRISWTPYSPGDGIPSEKGEFLLRNLLPSLYRIGIKMPNDNWYLASIKRTAVSAGVDLSRTGVLLKPGEKASQIVVTVTAGAAGVQGKLVTGKEGERVPTRMRIYLVPSESTAAEDPLRYAETGVRPDGSFSLSNLAPGKYRLIARPASDDELADRFTAPIWYESAERVKLRREAEAGKNVLELSPCQQVTDFMLHLNP